MGRPADHAKLATHQQDDLPLQETEETRHRLERIGLSESFDLADLMDDA